MMEQVQPHKHIAYVCYAPDGESRDLAARLTRFLQDFRVPHQLRRKNPRTPVTLASACAIPCGTAADKLSDGKFLVLVCTAEDRETPVAALAAFYGLLKQGEAAITETTLISRLETVPNHKKALVVPVLLGSAPVCGALAALGVPVMRAEAESSSFRQVASSLLGVDENAPWEIWEKHRKPHRVLRVALLSCAAAAVAAVSFVGGIYFAPQGEAMVRVEHAALTQDISPLPAESLQLGNRVHRTYERGSDGHIISISTYDDDGVPCPNENGVCRTAYSYDAYGNETSQSFFDENGKLCSSVQGYACVRTLRDERGLARRVSYYDQKGSLTENLNGYAEVSLSYDDDGNVVSLQYTDADGNPCECAEGYASLSVEYNDEGRMVVQRFYDAEGKLLSEQQGGAE